MIILNIFISGAIEHSDKFFVEYNPVCYYEWKLRYKGKTDQNEN